MGAGQVEAEGFRSLHQLAQVGVTAKQVVDEISSKSLLLADELAARLGVAVRERGHRLVHDLQERFGCRPHGAVSSRRRTTAGSSSQHAASRGEVEVDAAPDGYS